MLPVFTLAVISYSLDFFFENSLDGRCVNISKNKDFVKIEMTVIPTTVK